MNESHDWCVVYRTGGTENYHWQRTLAMSREAAEQSKREIEQGGRRAMVFRYSQSVSIGLPTTYAGTAWETAEDRKREEMDRLAKESPAQLQTNATSKP